MNESIQPDEQTLSAATDYIKDVRSRILFTLSIYTRLNPTQLQVSLGTSTRPSVWHPILDQLILDGLVEKIQVHPPFPSPSGRDQVYTVIKLVDSK